jgi:hypothetical protein
VETVLETTDGEQHNGGDFAYLKEELNVLCDRTREKLSADDIEMVRLVVRRGRREGLALDDALVDPYGRREAAKRWARRILHQLEEADREAPDRVRELEALVDQRLAPETQR